MKNHNDSVHISPERRAFEFRYVSATAVTRIIKKLKNTKARGVDGIPSEIWKKGLNVLASPIAIGLPKNEVPS